MISLTTKERTFCPLQRTGKLPTELFAIIGENNTGKTSLFKLIRTATRWTFWKEHWHEINFFHNKPDTRGTVACSMTEEGLTKVPKHVLGVHFMRVNGIATSVAFWLQKGGHLYTRRATLEDLLVPRQHEWPKEEAGFQETIKQICRFIEGGTGERGQRAENLISPWEDNESYLPTVICYPNAREQVEEYWQRTEEEAGNALAEREDIKQVAEAILQKAGYEQYEILKNATRSGHRGGNVIMIKNKQTNKTFKLFDLPGGHQYLLNIALNLAIVKKSSSTAPCCLLADEPTSYMHPTLAGQVAWLFKESCREYGLQVIMTTHSPHAIRALSLENIFRSRRLPGERTVVEELHILKEQAKAIEAKKLEEILFSQLVFVVGGESERRVMDALIKEMLFSRHNDNVHTVFPTVHRESTSNVTSDKIANLLRGMLVVSAGSKANVRHTMKLVQQLQIPCFGLMNSDEFLDEEWKGSRFASLHREQNILRYLEHLQIRTEYFEDAAKEAVCVETLKRMCNIGGSCTLNDSELAPRDFGGLPVTARVRGAQFEETRKETMATVKEKLETAGGIVEENMEKLNEVASSEELNNIKIVAENAFQRSGSWY